MNDRPDAAEALAAIAPNGLSSAPKDRIALVVRCPCREIVLRIVNTPAGQLAVRRHHNPPTAKQLLAKGAAWPGGDQYEARVVRRNGRTEIEDELATQVGWWDDVDWYPSEEEAPNWWSGGIHCACGKTVGLELLRLSVEAHLQRRKRSLVPPRNAVFDDGSAYAAYAVPRLQEKLAEDLAQERKELAIQRHSGTPVPASGQQEE